MGRGVWLSIKKSGLLKRVFKKPFLNDEPKLFGFGAEIELKNLDSDGKCPDPFASGTSHNSSVALNKTIFEAIERFCLAEFKFKDFIFGTFNDISKLYPTINPQDFCYFSKKQLKTKKFIDFSFTQTSPFYWVECKDMINHHTVYLPAQTIYCPYNYTSREKVLAFPITTGASLANTKIEAIYKGLCEIIERDAYMTSYLLKYKPRLIVYRSIKSTAIQKLLSSFDKYHLCVKSYILSSDLTIPTIMSIIFEQGRNGPPISIGLKTDLDLKNAIIGSIEEAFQIRYWIRTVMIRNDWSGDTYTSERLLKRAHLWINKSNINKLNFFTKTNKISHISQIELSRYFNLSVENKLKLLIQMLRQNNISAYYKDVTSKRARGLGINVVKCVVPNLHSMYLDQNFPYLGGKRIEELMKLNRIDKLNTYPHPFL